MKFVGADIGGTNVRIVLVSEDGTVLETAILPTEDVAEPPWASQVRAQIDDWGVEPDAVGIAAPGIARADGQAIYWMQGRMDALEGLDWTTGLDLGYEVPVVNDAQAALLAEAWIGAARGSQNVTLLTLGTGVGGAAIVDGNLLRGKIGRAGHLGHISLDPAAGPDITGPPGSLEDAIGEHTVKHRSESRFATTADLVSAHLAGDEAASKLWLSSVQALAAGVASLINVLDPEVVVLGGGISTSGDALLSPLKNYLETMEWRPHGHSVHVTLSEVGPFAGAIGAARNAMIQSEKLK